MHGFGHNHLHYAVSNVVFPGLYQQKGTRDAGRGLPLANPKLAMTGEVLDCLEAGSHVERICFPSCTECRSRVIVTEACNREPQSWYLVSKI